MQSSLKRKLTLGAVALAAAGSTAGAYAATRGSEANFEQRYMNDVASRLHVSPQQLRSAIQGALIDQLNAAVKAGRLTQAQANAIEQRIKQGGVPFAGPPPFAGPLPFLHGPMRLHHEFGPLAGVAKYLGLTDQQLFEQLRSGKSLAQIAKARGKSVAGLKQAITAAFKAKLDRAVADGRLTKAQEQEMLNRLNRFSSDLDARINGKLPRFGPPGPPPWRHGAGGYPAPGGYPGALPVPVPPPSAD